MNTHNTPPNIKHLVERAKALSAGKIKNKGRPRILMNETLAKTVSAMRKQGCSTSSIHRVLREEKFKGIEQYDNLQKFRFAHNQFKLYA